MRCLHCGSPCRYIGEQRGAEKYYGCRMYLWTCLGCGTTLSELEHQPGEVAQPRERPVRAAAVGERRDHA